MLQDALLLVLSLFLLSAGSETVQACVDVVGHFLIDRVVIVSVLHMVFQ